MSVLHQQMAAQSSGTQAVPKHEFGSAAMVLADDDAGLDLSSGAASDDVRTGLAQYLRDLKHRMFGDGTPLVAFPKTFSAQVHMLMGRWKQRRQGKLDSDELLAQDSELAVKLISEDVEVRQGMGKIAKLDEALREKQLEQLMVSRETYPEKWLQRDRDRIRKHGETVEAAIQKQRKEHARQRALRLKLVELGHEVGEEPDDLVTQKLLDRGFHLRQEDELLVESILSRDTEVEGTNPFDLQAPTVSLGSVDTAAVADSLQELDTKLMDLALDHDWNDCNSMMDMSTLGSLSARKCIPEVAKSVKRLGSSCPGSVGASCHGARGGFGMTLSVISEDTQCHNSTHEHSTAGSCNEESGPEPLARRRRRRAGRDYLTEMREERDLGRLSDKIDKEIRTLRESELPKASSCAIKAAVEQCLHQKQVHDERIQSGTTVCEWLRTPGASMGSASTTVHGAVSLAGPATDSGIDSMLNC
eukprot:jgi/Ulvmu1/7914/UM004_0146.1